METNLRISEAFLHYLWKYQLFDSNDIRTSDGESVKVLFPGYHNMDAGPDFRQAIVQIGGMKWVGDVEIHIRSSDWFRHQHQYDAKYRSVTLHVVCFHDVEVERAKGELFPTLVLKDRIPKEMLLRYQQLVDSEEVVPCRGDLDLLGDLTMQNLVSSLSMERLLRKQEWVLGIVKKCDGDWKEAAYRNLAVGFGFKTNAAAFELLAESLPYKLLTRHADSSLQVEALVFGQAGMLKFPSLDDYFDQLKYEYDYLRYKYQLVPIGDHHWNRLRMRPQNFPCLRLAQFARVLCTVPDLMNEQLQYPDVEYWKMRLVVTPHPYWETHYHFGCDTILKHSVSLGESAVNLLILNTIVPYLFAFHKFSGAEDLLERDVALLESLPFEDNKVTRMFRNTQFPQQNAQDSQALLELYGQYCRERRCLECAVGDCIVRRRHESTTS